MRPNHLVGNRYRLEAVLGSGGTCEVWRATDTATDRIVAVKLTAQAAANEIGEPPDMCREARALQRVNHPNVVKVLACGSQDGRRYMVMEVLEGPSLRDLLEQEGALDEERVAAIGMSLSGALQAAHEAGVIHNDIKPENIILVDGVPHLIDFGIARDFTLTLHPDDAGRLAGTLPYLAPEVLQGSKPNALSDIYALGVTLFEALAGHLPIAQESSQERSGSEPGFGKYGALYRVLLATMSPSPSLRPQTATDLGRILAARGATVQLTRGFTQMAPIEATEQQQSPVSRPAAASTGFRGYAVAGTLIGGVLLLVFAAAEFGHGSDGDSASVGALDAVAAGDSLSPTATETVATATEVPVNAPPADVHQNLAGANGQDSSEKHEEKAEKREEKTRERRDKPGRGR